MNDTEDQAHYCECCGQEKAIDGEEVCNQCYWGLNPGQKLESLEGQYAFLEQKLEELREAAIEVVQSVRLWCESERIWHDNGTWEASCAEHNAAEHALLNWEKKYGSSDK